MSLFGIRAASRKYMTSRATIQRPGEGVVFTDLRCVLRPLKGTTLERVVAQGDKIALDQYRIRFDADVAIERDDVVELTTTADPLATTRWFRVLSRTANDFVTTRHVFVEELTA